MTDGQLLGEFVSRRDEAAFARLVERHGPMVLGVCRRLLGHRQDAEDAFQATFIVLARRASSVRPREQVGNWLYGVAYRTALGARRLAAKRQAREKQVNDMPHPAVEPDALWQDVRPVLDEELDRLPNKYRLPIVLCDLESRTRKEVARQLGLPEGTLSNRLAAGRQLLAARLTRRGLTLSGAGLAAALSQSSASVGVPAALGAFTVKAALGMALEGATRAGVSVNVAALAQGALHGMFLTKLKIATAVLLVVGLLGVGVGANLLDDRAQGQEPAQDAPGPIPKGVAQKEAAQKKGAVPAAKHDDTALVERGAIQAAVFSDVVCGLKSSTIQWVAEDGAMVKKGDRIVVLDDNQLREQIRAQIVALAQAHAARAAAEANLTRVRKEIQLDTRAGEIEVKLAELNLRNSSSKEEREILALKVEQAGINLERVQLRGQVKEERATADLHAKTAVLDQQTARKRDMEARLGACVLYAPHDGIAVHYASEAKRPGSGVPDGAPVMAVGEPVREGQKLIRVLREDRFLILVHVPEARVSRLRTGQPATVRVDAFPNRALRGNIRKVSNVPSQRHWLNEDIKVYPVEVELTDPLPGLKQGMTGEVEIELERRAKESPKGPGPTPR